MPETKRCTPKNSIVGIPAVDGTLCMYGGQRVLDSSSIPAGRMIGRYHHQYIIILLLLCSIYTLYCCHDLITYNSIISCEAVTKTTKKTRRSEQFLEYTTYGSTKRRKRDI